MAYQDRETRLVETRKGSSAGWFIAGALVVALIAGAFFYSQGYFQDDDVSIELTLPNLKAE
ncbi:hypothetical protein [Roseibium limicola]|uniref:Uncharacterized protein n=1 Tax=Roseibium limicola TaxID=2816037 RepID=A0A939J539_9HYPH|nr:hypothetical protein [Roseibium limicola]MBO0343687.1 hypothetical protein [Roseibium limicola]